MQKRSQTTQQAQAKNMSSCFCGTNSTASGQQCPTVCLDSTAVGLIVGGVILGLLLLVLILGFVISRKCRGSDINQLVKAHSSSMEVYAIANEIFEEKTEQPEIHASPNLMIYTQKQEQVIWNSGNTTNRFGKPPPKHVISVPPIYGDKWMEELRNGDTPSDSAIFCSSSRGSVSPLPTVDTDSSKTNFNSSSSARNSKGFVNQTATLHEERSSGKSSKLTVDVQVHRSEPVKHTASNPNDTSPRSTQEF